MLQSPAFVLVHSLLVGPLTWEPTAESLRRKGHLVLVPPLGGGTDGGPPYYRKLARRVTAAVTEACLGSPVVVAGHSGAGALLPAIADEAGRKGWPVRRENADHLAMLTRPDQMADILDQLGRVLSG